MKSSTTNTVNLTSSYPNEVTISVTTSGTTLSLITAAKAEVEADRVRLTNTGKYSS